MGARKCPLAILIFTNIVVACLTQVICWSILSEQVNMVFFQFIVFPLIFVLINVVMAFQFKLAFYQYSFSAYLGFFCSIIVFAIVLLVLNRPEELPPGEIVLGADLVFIIFTSIVQLVILLLLNLILYVIFKIVEYSSVKLVK